MKKQFKFTNANIRALPANPPEAKSSDLEVSDTEIVGLKCLSGKGGNKRFLLRYTYMGKKGGIALGRFPDVDVPTARALAKKHKLQMLEGVDPKENRDSYKGIPTVSEFFWQTYMPLARKRKKSWKSDEQRFRDYCGSVTKIRYDRLRVADVQRVQSDMSSPTKSRAAYAASTCNRAIALLKTVGALAERLLDIPNVASRVDLLPENNARTRFCSVEEVRAIIREARAYHQKHIGSYIAMLFLTGCRASEMRLRKWEDVDFGNRTLTIGMTKNGTPHVVYLTDMMLDILAETPRVAGNSYIFAGTKPDRPVCAGWWAFSKIKERAGIHNPDEVVFHTARHSIASNLLSHADKTGADIRSVQELLNHKSIQSTMRYAKLSIERKRATSRSMEALLENSG